jgi:putative addiction module killer protein
VAQFILVEYVEDEKSYFAEWFSSLDAVPAARIDRYVRRMEFGNFGDSKSVGNGVRELRIDFGPG